MHSMQDQLALGHASLRRQAPKEHIRLSADGRMTRPSEELAELKAAETQRSALRCVEHS